MLFLKCQNSDVDAVVRFQGHGIFEGREVSQRNDVQVEVNATVFVQQGGANEVTHVRDGKVSDILPSFRFI